MTKVVSYLFFILKLRLYACEQWRCIMLRCSAVFVIPFRYVNEFLICI